MHEEGDEFWLIRGIYPVHVDTFQLSAHSDQDHGMVDIKLKKTTFKTINKRGRNKCFDYEKIGQGSFTDCSKVWQLFKALIKTSNIFYRKLWSSS